MKNEDDITIVKFSGCDDEFLEPEEVMNSIYAFIAEKPRDKSKEKAYNELVKQKNNHKGDWLTEKVVAEYVEIAKMYWKEYDGQYIGELRVLGEELMEKYGVTEIEAINILFNRNVTDYIDKYYRIKNLIV